LIEGGASDTDLRLGDIWIYFLCSDFFRANSFTL
jgi:hypothetical protein